jgi:hypothetical protein
LITLTGGTIETTVSVGANTDAFDQPTTPSNVICIHPSCVDTTVTVLPRTRYPTNFHLVLGDENIAVLAVLTIIDVVIFSATGGICAGIGVTVTGTCIATGFLTIGLRTGILRTGVVLPVDTVPVEVTPVAVVPVLVTTVVAAGAGGGTYADPPPPPPPLPPGAGGLTTLTVWVITGLILPAASTFR